MKLTAPPDSRRRLRLLRALASLALAVPVLQFSAPTASAQVLTNWVAFNDHIPGPGTALNVTPYNMWTGPGGYLTNFVPGAYPAGQPVSVHLDVTPAGNVAIAGTIVAPATGTPADLLFNGIVDMGAPGYLFTAGSFGQVTLSFTGLDPAMRYALRATSVRGRETDNPDRWTKAALIGAVSFVDANSSTNVLTSASVPTALTNGEAAWNSGRNEQAGNVVGRDDIDPGTDGSISIVSSEYTGPIPWWGPGANGAFGYGPMEFMLIEYGTFVPVFIRTQPAPSTTLTQLSSFKLSVAVSGSSPLFQWYKKGVGAIDGATLPTFGSDSAQPADSGDYYVVVSNTRSVTSTLAHVTVIADTVPPALVRAINYPTFDPISLVTNLGQVIVQFSEPVDVTIATDSLNYSLSDGTDTISATDGIVMTNNDTVAIIPFLDVFSPPVAENTLYTLTVTLISDRVGNLKSGATTQFRTWASSPANGVLYEAYTGVGGATDIPALTNSVNFPNNPFVSSNIWALDSRIVFPDDSHDNYGSRMRTLFVPPFSGDWVFFIRSDDPGQVYLNPSGASPSGRQLILNETGCCGDWDKYTSPAFPLTAGQGYYLETLHKETGGGDYIRVAARLDGTGVPPLGTALTMVDPASSSGSMVIFPYAPADVGGPLTVTGPSDVTVNENQLASFSVSASNPSGLPMFYQWRLNDVDIPGATAPTYSFNPPPTDDGSQISVQVAKYGSVVVSREALLTVTADKNPPTVLSVHGSFVLDHVTVIFSELVDPTTAQDISSYHLAGGITVLSATLGTNGTTVDLLLSATLLPGSSYQLSVSGVKDLASVPNTMANVTVTFPSYVITPGFLRFEYYNTQDGACGNNAIATLVNHPKFPNYPDLTAFMPAFNTRTVFPDDGHEGYGARILGYFIPPTTGNYIFYSSSDDDGELWLNPNGEDPTGLQQIVVSPSCCQPFSAHPSTDLFPAFPLTAGHRYFIQGLYKEGCGGDYMKVAAKLDSDPISPDSLLPISGNYLATLVDPQGASITITQQPLSQIVGVDPQVAPQFDFTQGAQFWSVFNLNSPTPWAYDNTLKHWTYPGSDPCGGPYLSSLQSPLLIATDAGDLNVSFVHRYSFEADSSANYDGGQVQLSVNGAPFSVVPGASFTDNGYTGTIGGTTVLADKSAFTGDSLNYPLFSYLTSTAALGTFSPGDKVLLRFAASQDECTRGIAPNWDLSGVSFSSGIIPAQAPNILFSVAASSVMNGAPSSYYFYQWQINTGAGWQDMPGENNSTLFLPFVLLSDSGSQFRAQVHSPGAVATSAAATLTVTLPLAVVLNNNQITVSWPAPATGYVLQSATVLNGIPASWATVPPANYTTTATTVSFTGPAPVGNIFYRLRKP